MYQRIGKAAYKSDLSNTLKLAEHLDHPENSFKSIHIGGTNGKGSTSHMLASILQEAGYKVGLYTSPHLKDFRERIKVDGIPIPKKEVMAFVSQNREFFEEHQLSFFEMTVGLAFDHFRKREVDIAVIEVGLGGRLDSTNIITPEISVITNIGMDHQQFLGDSIEKIAMEKAGIIKKGIPVIIGEGNSVTRPVFSKVAQEKYAPILFAEDMEISDVPSDLIGWYQKRNRKTVLAVVDVLRKIEFDIDDEAIICGLGNVVLNTGLQGRWQILREDPRVICDTAHNREGLALVLEQLLAEEYNLLHIVMGVTNDKDINEILGLFPQEARYYFCKASIPRGMDAETLKEIAENFGLKGDAYPVVDVAFRSALRNAAKDDLIFVGGSTFVVAEVL